MFNFFIISSIYKQKLLQNIYKMQLLAHKNLPKKAPSYKTQRISQSQKQQSKINRNHQQIHLIQQEKKNLNSKSKKILTCDYVLEDFKQNDSKHKVFKQLQQLDKLNANRQFSMTPFSSIMNTKASPIDSNKIVLKSYQTQNNSTNYKNQVEYLGRFKPRQIVEKLAQGKLNSIAEQKRKSISHRIHVTTTKQNNGNLQKKNIFKEKENEVRNNDKNDLVYAQEKRQNLQTQEQFKAPAVNRQKSSHSFMIRKKINSNVLQKQQKSRNCTIHCVKKYRKDRFIKDQQLQSSNFEKFNQKPQQSNLSPKNKLQNQQLKSKGKEQLKPINQVADFNSINHIKKPIKCIKIRVNKLLKTHEQGNELSHQIQAELIRNEANLQNEKDEDDRISQEYVKIQEICFQKLNHQNKDENCKKSQQKMVSYKSDCTSKIPLKQEICREIQTQSRIIKQYNHCQQENRNQVVTKQQVFTKYCNQTPGKSNVKNRKNRISSIRTIKNYYKHMQTEQKEQERQANIKKKQKQASCLTHKIKWGNNSKRKLESQRGLQIMNQFGNEFKILDKQQMITQLIAERQFLKFDNQQKNKQGILVNGESLNSERKKNQNKITFLQDQHEINQFYQKVICKKINQKEKPLQRNFAQTIQSKQFIESFEDPYHSGSKSLIIFQDPGISVIVNRNNSNHEHQSPRYTTIEQRCIEQQIQRGEFVSQQKNMKKKQYNDFNLQNGPLQSLQQLFYELKSYKSIKQDSLKMNSLQELCEENV